jgi:hypothetical protein
MPLPYPTEGGTSSCRATGERGPEAKRDVGAGRNRRGFFLRDFRVHGESRGGRFAAPRRDET